MKKANHKVVLVDLFLFITIVVLFGYAGVDAVMLSILIAIVPYLIITKRKHLISFILISFVISLIWKLIAGNYYSYSFKGLIVFGVNLYPIFFWTFGLFGTVVFFDDIRLFLRKFSFPVELFLFSSIFWVGLIIIEWTAYNLFGIKNIATGSYSGISGLNCIHAPLWMQISYFLMGPIYYLSLRMFKKV